MRNDPFGFVPPSAPPSSERQADFDQFEAMELYCPKCRQAVPVRKFLLLILPDGDKYEYRCQYCGTKVGDKMDKSGQYYGVLRR
ncbi:MAG: hypothetical protein JRI80_14995 [Deltaproteobacteria bacterium]|nr:hypothetical protein [Deltaproteobacteria bacterium]